MALPKIYKSVQQLRTEPLTHPSTNRQRSIQNKRRNRQTLGVFSFPTAGKWMVFPKPEEEVANWREIVKAVYCEVLRGLGLLLASLGPAHARDMF